ncbi:GntR family transcriptional regulator [Candidatus Solirubrobacter pratensis]|uniref:GntR family transcriptional regulator n=1 Tax=Candidatus Solirubrobacter pratensis TaxID=1298857 RepID=UPI0003FA977E|nr:GntR family transcriptional regulator [Candidatus Solirubrobacter pratensis]
MADRTELRSIRRTNLREEAVSMLRAAILGGELEPGSIHSAASLADRLGVSPTPVREAMLALVLSGLVEVLPNRGFRVTVIDENDLDEICALRLMLEVPAIALAVERASDASLNGLRTRLAELEDAAANSDVSAFLVADRAFHLELLALAGNRRLVRIVAELRDQTRIVGLQSLAAAETLEAIAAEHRPILEAIQARDVAAAQRSMTVHLEHTRGAWAGHAEA